MVVLGIVGSALVKMMLSQGRFMDQQEAWRSSRAVARSTINGLYSDVRDVEAVGGVEAAAAGGKDFTLRVPYAFGIMCSTGAGGTTLSLLPVDSTMFAGSGFSGFAWRDANGVYQYVTTGVALNPAGTVANCTAANITTLPSINGSPAGKVVNVTGTVSPVPPVGTIFFLFRRVRYEFKASTSVPGRVGLWRTLLTPNLGEELATPFDTSARVNFYVDNNPTAQSAVPGLLSSIRGFEFRLDGQSERAPRGSAGPKATNLTTSIFFSNRPD
jgi:hypothetical protein